MLFRLLLFSGMILIAGVGALSVPGSNTGDAAGSSGASGASGGTSTAGGTSGNAGSAASGATSGASSGAKKLASNPSAATSGSAMQCCNTLARPDNLNQCRSKIGRSTICAKVHQFHLCFYNFASTTHLIATMKCSCKVRFVSSSTWKISRNQIVEG